MNEPSTSGLSPDAQEFVPNGRLFVYPPLPVPAVNLSFNYMGSLYPPSQMMYSIHPLTIPVPQPKQSLRNNLPQQKNLSDKDQFLFRVEDFPTLPLQNSIPVIPTPVQPLASWNSVVSSSRPQSKSSNRADPPAPVKPPNLTKSSVPVKSPKPDKKQKKPQKVKADEASAPEISTSFVLDDEKSFPVLGQDAPVEPEKNSINLKSPSSTPRMVPKSRLKPHQTYEIRLTDMFHALSTSTQTKRNSSAGKSNLPIANPLDSKPAAKRGKERENPKPRKPTKLKRIINKELEQNQKQRQETNQKTNSSNEVEDTTENRSSVTNSQTGSSASSYSEEESNDEDLDEQQPTSQSQTPFAQEMPSSNLKQQIHDGTFREYCTQLIDRQLDELCVQLLLTLKRFQDRKKQQFQSNPERARRKRRFVHGIREVTKHLRSQRLKCVFIAPDCQSIQSQGGLNQAIDQILNLCKEQNVPFVFTLNRQKLGRCLNKVSRVSTIGIFDYSGAEQIYKQMLDLAMENQRAYKQILDHDETMPSATASHGLNSREFFKILHRAFQQQAHPAKHQHVVNTIPSDSLSKVLPKVPAHYGHSRQTSDTSMIYIDPQLINSMKKQHNRASSGTFDLGHKKTHHRALSDGATTHLDIAPTPSIHKHSRTPSGCSAISQIEQNDYFEQSKHILNSNGHVNDELLEDSEENRLKSIHEDTEDSAAFTKRKHVERWINEN